MQQHGEPDPRTPLTPEKLQDPRTSGRGAVERTIHDLVYVGFNSRIAALDRYTGDLVWEWKSPQGSGFVSLLLDGDRLIASVNGYTYCLDPLFGQQVWANELKGFGVGTPCLASANGTSGHGGQAAVIAQQQAAAAASSAYVPG